MIARVVRLTRLLAVCAAACTSGDPSAPVANTPSVDVVAAALTRTSDSLLQAGNVAASVPFGDAGNTLASLGRRVTVRVTEGNVIREYQAVAQRYLVPSGPGGACAARDSNLFAQWAPYPIGCTLALRPVLLLWRGSAPEEVIEIYAAPGVSRVGETWLGLLNGGAPPRPTGSVLWERAARRAWVATLGSVTIGESQAGAPCARPPRLPPGVAGNCATGTQRAAFDLTYTSTDSSRDSTAARPTRHLTLAVSDLPLVLVTITNAGSAVPMVPDSGVRPPIFPPNPNPPPDTGSRPPTPPPVPPDSARPPVPTPPPVPSDSARPRPPLPPPVAAPFLVSRVDARLEPGVVKLTLIVVNLSRDSVVALFGSGQEFDFQLRSGDTPVWTWSATRDFQAVAHSLTWASGQTRVFSAEWAGPGIPIAPMVAKGWLTSRNQPLESFAPVVVVPVGP